MATPSLSEVLTHCGRTRRRVMGLTPGLSVRDVAGGWMTIDGATAGEDMPSMNRNRMYWLERASEPTAEEIGEVIGAARESGVRKLFFWLGPGAWGEGVRAGLERAGAREWPHVRYPVMVGGSGAGAPAREGGLDARVVGAEEVGRVLEEVRGWFAGGAPVALPSLVKEGFAEVHAAFVGERPVATGALMMDGVWGYLGFAATHAEFRGRGGQSALIASRVRSAARRGARWCVSETNTAVETSLRNLTRAGFVEAWSWRVWVWEGR